MTIIKNCICCKKPIPNSDVKLNSAMLFCYKCVEAVSMNKRLQSLIIFEDRKITRRYH